MFRFALASQVTLNYFLDQELGTQMPIVMHRPIARSMWRILNVKSTRISPFFLSAARLGARRSPDGKLQPANQPTRFDDANCPHTLVSIGAKCMEIPRQMFARTTAESRQQFFSHSTPQHGAEIQCIPRNILRTPMIPFFSAPCWINPPDVISFWAFHHVCLKIEYPGFSCHAWHTFLQDAQPLMVK